MDLVGCFWSGKHYRSIKDINLITLGLFHKSKSDRLIPCF